MTTRHLLDEHALLEYLRRGYVTLRPGFAPGFHERILAEIEGVFVEGNPGNDILPKVPGLQEVFDHPAVAGVLGSILGPGYMMHPHRHCHLNPAGSDGQHSHQDSYEDDYNVRHHHTRWAMAFYYPQDVSRDMGPTAVQPGTQCYYEGETVGALAEEGLCGPAGTVTIVHYDLWHRAMDNYSDRKRYMAKFLFCRRQEPKLNPRPDMRVPSLVGAEHVGLLEHQWQWHAGQDISASPPEGDVNDWMMQLESGSEPERLDAAYALGRFGQEAVPKLIDLMGREASDSTRKEEEHRNPGQLNSLYALSAVGETAVPGLVDALDDDDSSVRATAADLLGDIGSRADLTIPALARVLDDDEMWVRRNAVEALGVFGPAAEPAVPRLGAALSEDPSDRVRHNAALAMARIGSSADDAMSALRRALDDENPYVKANSILALEQVDTTEARRVLEAVPAFTGGGRYAEGSKTEE